ncbi:MAG: DUF2867 domain-containing protein [Ramlibacter sp.]
MSTATNSVRLIPTPQRAEQCSGLSRIDFADCYHGRTARRGLTAMGVARAMFEHPPAWVGALMATRNAVMGCLGLKTPSSARASARRAQAGIFPVLSETPGEVLLGLDDKHLDFRIWVSVQPIEGGTDIRTSTLVHLHGWPGRLYLFLIMPFHKLLSRYMLARALRAIA